MGNIAINQGHYDEVYSNTDKISLSVIASLNDFENWFTYVSRYHKSWRGFYHEGFLNRLKGKKILEIGGGDSLNSSVMAKVGQAKEVTVIDISSRTEKIVKNVSNELNIDNVRSISGELSTIKLNLNYYDIIVGKNIIHHLEHSLEKLYYHIFSKILKNYGEVRLLEPATNSIILDKIRWIIPLRDRPSILNKSEIFKYKENDPHPIRDNSSKHYRKYGRKYFTNVSIVPFGAIERFHRLIRHPKVELAYLDFANYVERKVLPDFINFIFARNQLVTFRGPKKLN